MKPIFAQILQLACPWLDTRKNDIHTRMSIEYAYRLLECEKGDEDIVIPAVILHDVGRKEVPEKDQLGAFGPKAVSPALNRVHEMEGVKIARRILDVVGYPGPHIREIVVIIEGHDSRKKAFSSNDRLVKDADKLWRYSREGFNIDVQRFRENPHQGIKRLRDNLEKWFYTKSAQDMAKSELRARMNEWGGDRRHL